MSFNWTDEQIESYLLGIVHSDYPAHFWQRIEKALPDMKTFRDIGSGPGAFALQAALAGLDVEAVDINRKNLEALKQRQDELKLTNIRRVEGDWIQIPAEKVDVSLCACSLGGGIGSPEGIRKVIETTGKAAFWIAPFCARQTDFLSAGLYENLGQEPPSFSGDYRTLLKDLRNLGLEVSREVLEYDFGVPYKEERGLKFYTKFFGEKLKISCPMAMEEHLNGIMTTRGGLPWFPNPKKSVMITWKKE